MSQLCASAAGKRSDATGKGEQVFTFPQSAAPKDVLARHGNERCGDRVRVQAAARLCPSNYGPTLARCQLGELGWLLWQKEPSGERSSPQRPSLVGCELLRLGEGNHLFLHHVAGDRRLLQRAITKLVCVAECSGGTGKPGGKPGGQDTSLLPDPTLRYTTYSSKAQIAKSYAKTPEKQRKTLALTPYPATAYPRSNIAYAASR